MSIPRNRRLEEFYAQRRADRDQLGLDVPILEQAEVSTVTTALSDDEIIERMAKELLHQRPLLAGRKWHELKEVARISLKRDAERLLRISRGEDIHA